MREHSKGWEYLATVLKREKRYWLVVLLLSIALIFGGTLSPNKVVVPGAVPVDDGRYFRNFVVNLESGRTAFPHVIETRKDEIYRLVFRVNYETQPGGLWGIEETNRSDRSAEEISVILRSRLGEEQEVARFVAEAGLPIDQNLVFKSNASFSELVVRPMQDKAGGRVNIRNLMMTRLGVADISESKQLSPLVFEHVKRELIHDWRNEQQSVLARVGGRGELVGQIFRADQEYISAVEIGLGGKIRDFGPYWLEIREVDVRAGVNNVSNKVISRIEIDSLSNENPGSKSGRALFSLYANLEKDKHYFVGLNCEPGRPRLWGNVKILGAKGMKANEDGLGVLVKSNGKTENIGQIDMALYGKRGEKDGEINMTGTMVGAIEPGREIFVYETRGLPEDMLRVQTKIEGDGAVVRYDGARRAITGTAEGDTSFIYKFDTKHPYKKVGIEAEEADGLVNARLWYSCNQVDWKPIDRKHIGQEEDRRGRFDKTIDGDGICRTLFIKVGYNTDDVAFSREKLFGLKLVRVYAETIAR